MFEHRTYIGYTLIFCLPAITLLWTRAEFARALRQDLRGILLATGIVSVYGSLIWPLAIHWHCWSYAEGKILNVKLLNYVFVEDAVWWALVGFLVSCFVALATQWEKTRGGLPLRELFGLSNSFRAAIAGFRVAGLERNMTIHVSAAITALLAAWLFRLSRVEWMFVVLAIAGVMTAELLNCAIERLAPGREERVSAEVRLLKDAAAAGVLVAAAAAAFVGAAVFMPRVLAALQ
jgi:undecaprenol kinase